jgi:hypothetical protein
MKAVKQDLTKKSNLTKFNNNNLPLS